MAEARSRLDLDLRGWAKGTKKMLAFQLGLRDSPAMEFKGRVDSL